MSETRDYPRAELLATVEWLANRLGEPDLQIVDVRPPMPQFGVGYPWGHIPGAVYLDLMQVFTGAASGVPGSLGQPEEIAAAIGNAGLPTGNTVVIYDGQGGPAAAQAFWLLEALGFADVRLLEGGFAAWQSEGHPVSLDTPSVVPVEAPGMLDAERMATLDWLVEHLDDPSLVVVDARTPGEHTAGHIPGAVLLPWDDNLEVAQVPRFHDATTLRARLEASGVTPDKEVVTYCQTGVRSAHVYFVLRLLGYPTARNYDGSWQEWGARPDTPKTS